MIFLLWNGVASFTSYTNELLGQLMIFLLWTGVASFTSHLTYKYTTWAVDDIFIIKWCCIIHLTLHIQIHLGSWWYFYYEIGWHHWPQTSHTNADIYLCSLQHNIFCGNISPCFLTFFLVTHSGSCCKNNLWCFRICNIWDE